MKVREEAVNDFILHKRLGEEFHFVEMVAFINAKTPVPNGTSPSVLGLTTDPRLERLNKTRWKRVA